MEDRIKKKQREEKKELNVEGGWQRVERVVYMYM